MVILGLIILQSYCQLKESLEQKMESSLAVSDWERRKMKALMGTITVRTLKELEEFKKSLV